MDGDLEWSLALPETRSPNQRLCKSDRTDAGRPLVRLLRYLYSHATLGLNCRPQCEVHDAAEGKACVDRESKPSRCLARE
jgi:hypothetical protein